MYMEKNHKSLYYKDLLLNSKSFMQK